MIALDRLDQIHNQLNSYLKSIPESKFNDNLGDKWNPAQHTDHLYLSLKLLNKALRWPTWILQWKFAKCNRPERTYEETEAKYKSKLITTDISKNPFLNKVLFPKDELLRKYKQEQDKFEKRIQSLSANQRKKTILPHPLLGRMNLNEFVDFNILHTRMHAKSIGLEIG